MESKLITPIGISPKPPKLKLLAKSYDMDGNKSLKGSELGAAAADFAAKDAPAEEAPAEEESTDESSEDGDKEPEVVWRNSGDSQDDQ